MYYLLIHNDDGSIFIFITSLMDVDNEIKYRRWMAELRPVGTVKHPNAQFVVVLNRLYGKIAANVVAFINLGFVFDAVVIRHDWNGLFWPELRRGL